jgi:ubiquitin-conjugating enzyme E2 Q
MSLAVPLLPSTSFMHGVPVIYDSPQAAANAPAPSTVDLAKQLLKAKYDFELQEIVFDSDRNPVRPGDWIVLIHPGRLFPLGPTHHMLIWHQGGTTLHYRVQDVSRFPTVALSSLGTIQQPGLPGTEMARLTHTPATTPPARQLVEVEVAVYDHNFDDMADPAKAQLIAMLLETLPTLRDMRAYLLQQQRIAEPNLRAWKEQVSSAALGLLRWIVASNRSCIVQVDSIPGQDAFEIPATKVRLEQKLSNVTERYVQFRFAQGAPDKEQRFLNALKDNRDKLNPLHPTLFAWHGSPLQNWHSIIRSGLDFKETLHGRAYGHGVYHAMDQNTSVGYAQVGAVSPQEQTKPAIPY